ncbi:FAD-binding oxidoreductase [Kribbella qitaiheensis]|uniref:FAD-binding oxidoreductase n=1 Tax=Kribbella qitaiheensis TaxID=1544730 RepID=UPI003618FA94
MTLTPQLLEVLRTHVAGRVVGADDPAWDVERGAWHLLADQRPAAVVHVTGADDIAATIRFARRQELAVSAQPVGHGASPAVNGTILLRTGGLTAIDVDIASGVVRVEAGVRWRDLNDALTGTGLTSLPGSSGDTTVVGYTLGGGLSWFGRKYGQAANSVRSFELVNAHGDFHRVTHESDPELFWALRGGGGEFGIIVAMELEPRLAPEIQGGRMLWPIEHARDVLRAFADVTATAPEELTLWAWLLNLPDVSFVPEPLRGKWVAAVDSTFLGSEEDNEKLLAPLRAVAEPIADTVARVPLSGLGSIAQEPDEPVPGLIKTVLLSGFDSDAIDSLLEVAAPGTPSSLFAFEVRHLGGALARSDESQGVAGVIEEPYLLLFGGFVAGPGMAEMIEGAIDGVEAKMAPWITGHNIPNFSTAEPLTTLYSAESLDRLRAIKHRVDPRGTIRGNRPIS